MRRPLQDTPPGYLHEAPADALAADEALLDHPPGERWYVATRPAVVLGVALHRRAASVLDLERGAKAGVQVLERRAGGGAVLLDSGMLCYAVALPIALVSQDLTESYRWLGEHFAERLQGLGVPARRIEIAEARADVAQHRHDLLGTTCYGLLSPHEVVVGSAKIVGLAQVRRRHAALFQVGILLRDQSGLADYLRVPDPDNRERLRQVLRERTVGLETLIGPLPLDRSTSGPLDHLVAALSPDLPAS
jgi:lipoate---protein ligase